MNIDPNKITIPFNRVLIKLDGDFETYHNTENGADTGLYVAPWGINAASHLAVTGTVVKLPERLIYNGYEVHKMKGDKEMTDVKQKQLADLRRESMTYDVPIEITPGLRVYFEYRTRLDAYKEGRWFENEDGNYILVPYDLLVMAFQPRTDFNDVKVTDVYPLNGFVLVKPLEYATETNADGIKGVKTENDLFLPAQPEAKYVKQGNAWYGTILAVGCGVKSYLDYPGRSDGEARDTPLVRPGNKIIFDGRLKKRLEVEHHRVIFKKHTLYRIHRKDISAFLPNGL